MNINVLVTYHGLPLIVTGEYLPGTPGRLSGPPEFCYPPEGAELEDVTVATEEGTDLTQFLNATNHLESVIERALEAANEDFVAKAYERNCERAEAEWEARREASYD